MIEAEFNTAKLEKAFRKFPGVLREQLEDGFDHIGRSFLSKFRKERLQGPPGIKSWGKRGIYSRFKRRKLVSTGLDDMGTEIYADSKIAAMHETGAVVTDAGGGRMAVPFSKEYKPKMYAAAGRLRKPFKDPRTLKNTAVVRMKGKDFLVKFRTKKNRSIEEASALYVLKNKIVVRPRLGFFKTVDAHAGRRIQVLNKAVVKAIKIGYYGP
ncbi:MAG: hypothetical protein KAX15_02770 [Candidatus Omnitrophica bacterium]|nr:hypothetical protein [Candidatus Omnitrophota bacterium]